MVRQPEDLEARRKKTDEASPDDKEEEEEDAKEEEEEDKADVGAGGDSAKKPSQADLEATEVRGRSVRNLLNSLAVLFFAKKYYERKRDWQRREGEQ